MAVNYMEDIDRFVKKLGPPDQLHIGRFEVGCTACNPNFVVGRNFNSKAKLVNHFKSQLHLNSVDQQESRKEDHVKTLEENLSKIDEEIKSIEEEIESDRILIKKTELETVQFKHNCSELHEDFDLISKDSKVFQCPSCRFKTEVLKKYKKHLRSHGDSTSKTLLSKLK